MSYPEAKNRKSHDHMNRCRKSIGKNLTHIHNQNSLKTRTVGRLPPLESENKQNLSLTPYLKTINRNFSTKFRNKPRVVFLPLLLNVTLTVSNYC